MGTVVKPYTFTNGAGNLIDATQVNADFDTLYTLANGNIQAINLKSGDGLFDAYKDVIDSQGAMQGGQGSAAHYFPNESGGMVLSAANLGGSAPGIFYFDDADYTVVGKTLKMRIRATVGVNGTATGVNFRPGLYPVTISGGGGPVAITLGGAPTAVAGSNPLVTNPPINTFTPANSGDFTVPADGAYILGWEVGGTLAANSWALFNVRLQVRVV